MSDASYRFTMHSGVMIAVPEPGLELEVGATMQINYSASQENLFATATEFCQRIKYSSTTISIRYA